MGGVGLEGVQICSCNIYVKLEKNHMLSTNKNFRRGKEGRKKIQKP